MIHDPNLGDLLNHAMRAPMISGSRDADIFPPSAAESTSHVQQVGGLNAVPPLQNDMNGTFLLSLDEEEFVRTAYLTILGRVPDPAGEHYYLQRLKDGIARIEILGQMAASGESDAARRWYRTLRFEYLLLKFRRMPVIGWFCELVCAFTRSHLNELLVHDDDKFVVGAFQSVLGRVPDPQGFEHYLTQIRSGREKIDILADIRMSPEGRAVRGRVAGLTVASWLRKLRNAPVIKWVINAFTLPFVAADGLRNIRGIQSLVHRSNMQQQSDILAVRELLKEGHVATLALIQQIAGHARDTAILMDQETAALSDELNKLAGNMHEALTKTQADLARCMDEVAAQRHASLTQSAEAAKAAILMRETLIKTQADLARCMDEVAVQRHASLTQSVEAVKAAILPRLVLGERVQQHLLQQLRQGAISNAALVGHKSAALSRELSMAKSDIQSALTKTRSDLVRSVQGELHAGMEQLNSQLGRIELYGLTAARRVAVPCGVDVVMLRTNVGYVLCASEDHALIAALIERGELEPGTRLLIQRLLRAGDVFVDVGANVGMHTLAAAQAMRGHGRVFAFEPYGPTTRLLEKTIWVNGFANMVEIYCVAATDGQGERTLYLGPTSGHHSLFPLNKDSVTENAPVKVHATTVDQIMASVPFANLVKIDVEGAELEVLAGAAALLQRSKEIGIIAEFGGSHLKRTGVTSQEWLDHFRKLGLRFQSIHPDSGMLSDITVGELDAVESVNLFFARPNSPLWKKARDTE
jgi:FkbM family methyltransferase